MPTTRKGRKDIENSGYYRAYASQEKDVVALEMAKMLSESQATVISNGNMLDSKIIPDPTFNPNNVKRKVKSTNLDPNNCIGHYAHFELMQGDCKGKTTKKKCIQIDYVSITDKEVKICEIKDGDNFDTKKSEGEVESLLIAQDFFKALFPDKKVTIHVVLWNAKDITKVSFKAKGIPDNFLVRGRDFCEEFNIDWDAIATYRMSIAEQEKNNLIARLEEVLRFAREN